MQPTEKDFEAACIAAAEKEKWHFGRDEHGNILWLSEGSLALTCLKAGYAMATAATPAPASDEVLAELEAAMADENAAYKSGSIAWPEYYKEACKLAYNAAPALLARVRQAEAHSATLLSNLAQDIEQQLSWSDSVEEVRQRLAVVLANYETVKGGQPNA